MDKWKIAVIIALFAMLLGYGAYQAQPQTPSVASNAATGPNSVATAPPPSKQPSFKSKTLPAWNFPASAWMNTAKPLTPADFKGSVTLVEVFRIECSHCIHAAPIMAQIYRKYKSRGLKMLSIQAPGPAPTENSWPTVKAKVREWGWQHPVAFDADAMYFKGKLGGQSYPSVYLLDKNGVVVYYETGEDEKKTQALLLAIEKALSAK